MPPGRRSSAYEPNQCSDEFPPPTPPLDGTTRRRKQAPYGADYRCALPTPSSLVPNQTRYLRKTMDVSKQEILSFPIYVHVLPSTDRHVCRAYSYRSTRTLPTERSSVESRHPTFYTNRVYFRWLLRIALHDRVAPPSGRRVLTQHRPKK